MSYKEELIKALLAGANDPMWADHCEMPKSIAKRAAMMLHELTYKFKPDDCPKHTASSWDAKICGNCGIHVDSLR